jgi:hypothetical protein
MKSITSVSQHAARGTQLTDLRLELDMRNHCHQTDCQHTNGARSNLAGMIVSQDVPDQLKQARFISHHPGPSNAKSQPWPSNAKSQPLIA